MSANEQRSSRHRLLTAARFLWLVYAIGLLILYLASLRDYIERVPAGTVPDVLFDVAWPTGNAYFTARAATAGVSLSQYLAANISLSLLVIIIHFGIAALIFRRLPNSWFGLLSAWVILLTGSSAMEDAFQVAGLGERLGPILLLFFNLGALVWPIFPIWLYLFPDGRAVPRWARWPIGITMGVFTIFMIIGILDSVGLLPREVWRSIGELNERADLVIVLVLPGLLLSLGSQVYRYLRVSGPIQRQQTKWFLLGLGLFVLFFPLGDLPLFQRLEAINGSLTLTIIPISIAISLLRYRLWDVDVVIRRTAGYAILTGLLLLIYFGSVIVLQRMLAPLTGASTPATILSTLLIAGLFLPLRRRVQELIDRRFYRRKYDAAKVLESFAATARDETDLDMLTAELVRVIQETMQPEHVSIWLRDTSHERRVTNEKW